MVYSQLNADILGAAYGDGSLSSVERNDRASVGDASVYYPHSHSQFHTIVKEKGDVTLTVDAAQSEKGLIAHVSSVSSDVSSEPLHREILPRWLAVLIIKDLTAANLREVLASQEPGEIARARQALSLRIGSFINDQRSGYEAL